MESVQYQEPQTWHEQDWLIISTPLSEWINDREPSPQKLRASQLRIGIAEYIDLCEFEFEDQIDPSWTGPVFNK